MTNQRATSTISLAAILLLLPIALMLPAAWASSSFGNVGSQVATGNTDFRPTLYTLAPFLARVDKGSDGVIMGASPSTTTNDAFYLYARSTSTSTVEPGALRLTAAISYGSFVAAAAADDPDAWTAPDGTSAVTTTALTSLVKWIDTDGKSGYTSGDMVYVDMPAVGGCSGSGSPSVCDIRLTSGTVDGVSYSAGTLVQSGDKEIGKSFGSGTFTLKYYDANTNFDVDSGDAVYAVPTGVTGYPSQTSALIPVVGDVRIAPYSGYTAGAKVAKSDADTIPSLAASANFDCLAYGVDGAGSTDYPNHKYFLHRDTTGTCTGTDAIGNGDIVIDYTNAQSIASGTIVSSVSNGAGVTITNRAVLSSNLIAADADNNGVYSAGDALYFNRPSAWGGSGSTVDAGDVRLTAVTLGGTTYAAGKVVAAGDADISGFSGSTILTGFQLRMFDNDRESSVGADTNDQFYIQKSGITTTIPHLNDVRLIASFGQKVTTSSTGEWIPTLTAPTATDFKAGRYDIGGDGVLTNDLVYINGAAASTTVGSGAARLTGYQSGSINLLSGTQAQTGDFDLGASVTQACSTVVSCVGYVDAGGGSTLGANDILYLDTNAFGVSTAGFGAQDIRLNTFTWGGTTYNGGSFALAGSGDVNAFQGTAFASPPCLSKVMKYWDDNADGQYNVGDTLYLTFDTLGGTSGGLTCPGAATSLIPRLLDVRLTGPGGSSVSQPTGGGGGGGGVVTYYPTLSNGAVAPAYGVTGSIHTFSVTYSHGGGFSPSTAQLFYNGTAFDMTASCSSYAAGCSYSKSLSTGGVGAVPFYFQFSQGGTSARYPSSGNLFLYLSSSSDVAPTLSSASVLPAEGNASTDFVYTVTYTDLNNDAPTLHKVVIDGTDHVMTSSDTTYYDGAVYTFTTKLGAGSHSYQFMFRDASHDVSLPASSTTGPTVTAPATAPTETTATQENPATTSTSGKSPGFDAVLVALALAGMAVVVTRRKR